MSDERYCVSLKEICSVFEDEYVPRRARKFDEEKRRAWTFVILPYAEGDEVADREFFAQLKVVTEDELTAATTDLVKKVKSYADIKPILDKKSSDERAIQFWRLRRFVRPPEGFLAYWDYRPADVQKVTLEDPMTQLPGSLIGELHTVLFKKMVESCVFLPSLKDGDEGAADAVPKSSPA